MHKFGCLNNVRTFANNKMIIWTKKRLYNKTGTDSQVCKGFGPSSPNSYHKFFG